MRIVICGGGSLGHTCAGVFSTRQDVIVDLYTNHPGRWNKTFKVNLPSGEHIIGKLDRVDNDPSHLIPQADIVFLCLPAYLVEETILRIKPFLKKESIIGAVVGNSGIFIHCHKHLPQDTKIFSFQRVPYISRVVEYGKEANLLGYRDKLIMATENIVNRTMFREQMERLFGEPITLADSFYEVTLSNSNPILHTGRLYTMWHNWDGTPFGRCSLFYKEWTDEASRLEIEMDNEFFALLNVLHVETNHIATLLEHYESKNAEEMTAKLRSIPSLSTILSPMKKVEAGWLPDFTSRYFTEDFPFGLKLIRDLSQEHHLETPHIDQVLNWGLSICH